MESDLLQKIMTSHHDANNQKEDITNSVVFDIRNKKKVLIISKVNIENGAGGTRIQNLTKILDMSNNYHISCYGFSDKKNLGETIERKNNYHIISIGNYQNVNRLKKYKIIFYGRNLLKQIFIKEKPDIIIVYSTLSFRNISFVKKYAKQNNIKLFFDVVEFRPLLASLSPFAFFGYNLHNNLISTHFINSQTNGVICPTHFLEKHFISNRKCKNIFYLPITMNIDGLPKYNKNVSINRITYLYAGNPNKKRDLLANMIKAFNNLSHSDKAKIVLIICGISPKAIIKKEGLTKNDYIKSLEYTYYLGSIPKSTLNQIYPNIDYGILLKNPNKRFSKAGFPTKMAECFSCGIPLVCNLSGDMPYFAIDGFNCIVSPTYQIEDFKQAIEKSIQLYSNHNLLSKNALKTAELYLKNENYIDLNRFIDK